MENLSKRDYFILKQEKVREILLMDRIKYTENFVLLLNTKHLKNLAMTTQR